MKFASLQRDCVWSATPTPFTPDGRVDVPSVQRLVSHHLALGVSGVMLAGTSWYQKKFVDSGWDPGLKHGEWITPQKELAKAKD